jgi:3-oxoacyl-(acyl-carrier-protein) synthase
LRTAVAVTGIGLVTPLGVGREENSEAARRGPATPQPPDPEEAQALPTPLVCRVPDHFDPRRYLKRRKDLKLMARANRLAVAAARLAVEDAGLGDADLTEAGLWFGVGCEPGDSSDLLPALPPSRGPDGDIDPARLATDGMGRINPLSSLKTLPNMSLAHVSIAVGAMGPNQALCAGREAGARALLEAARAVADGAVRVALAGAADAPIAFGERLAAVRLGRPGPASEAAAVLVLEPLEVARARGATVFGLVSPRASAEPPETRAPDLLGDCGAARDLAGLALALSLGQRATAPPVAVEPPVAGAPAVQLQRRGPTTPIAVTGVGLQTSIGSTFDAFTAALLDGRCGTDRIRSFDAAAFPARCACEIADFVGADALPGPLAAAMRGLDDRKGELALACALAAATDHGAVDPGAGAVYGTGLSSVSLEEVRQDFLPFVDADARFDYARFAAAPTLARPQAPLRHEVERPLELLAAHLRLSGPTAAHFSACAAGAAAIAHAADLIRRGEAPMMLAGSADSMIHPLGLIPFILLGATSTEADPARAGRPFDAQRDGFVMGEGGAFFVLEPLDVARAAGRRVYGVLLGAGSSVDAHNVTAPHPEGAGAERAMRAALRDAGRAPADVDYINAHGTGTPLNDVVESAAIRRVFGPSAPPVSSSKAQLGHTIAAAGAVELAACLATFAGARLPPNPHTEQVDPRIDLDLVGPTGRAAEPRILLSNSFGFGGQNACLVVGRPDHDL